MKTNATHTLSRISTVVGILAIIATIVGTLLASNIVSADVVDKVNITVPMSCTLEGTGMNTHNAEINNGQYNSNIGETTLKAFCNDTDGFAIYAIGYTDNLNGKNVLTNADLGSAHDIVTGTAISGANSNWAMKLSTVTSPTPVYPITIENSFDAFHNVPNTHTLVAKRTAGTDIGQNAEGSTLKTTYQAYISSTQSAGTYTGQVKYTLVHPNDNPTPPDSMLDIGTTVNTKMKSLASGTTITSANTADSNIKAIKMANSLPANFEPSEANTVSTPDSKYPIYIFFDNTNDAGIMYFYTENETVAMNPDSGMLFRRLSGLADISGLANWDASNATSLYMTFAQDSSITSLSTLSNWNISKVADLRMTFAMDTGLTNLNGLEDWDVYNVTNMTGLFYGNTNIISISALADWNVENAQNVYQSFEQMSALTSLHGLESWNTNSLETMRRIFYGDVSLTDVSAISNWNTSNVTDMSYVFARNKALTSINVSNWDTSNVENMSRMFMVGDDYVGNGQLAEIIGLGNWDVSNVTNMTTMFYGAGNMTHYDIANWNVSKVESFNHMFCDNFKLESLDLSKWDVSNVKTMYNMFDDDRALVTIGDVSHWNTSNLIDASGWLNDASSFVGINGILDLSGWNTTNLKAAEEMFRATKLQTIDLSGWTFDSITNDGWEGAGSGIYYSYGTGLDIMFKDTAQLNTVYVSQAGLNSFNTAVNNGVDTTGVWSGSGASGFTVK